MACVATACGGDSDDEAAGATTSPPATGTTAVTRTTEPPPPGSPVPFTTVSEVMWPDDVAALRATLDQFGVPDWWPLPDSLAPSTAPYSTVQRIVVGDTITRGGDRDSSGFHWTTWWLVETLDLTAAETAFVAKVPSDRYDVAAGVASRSEVIENGRSTITLEFPLHDQYASGGLSMSLKDAIDPGTGVRLGTLVELAEGSAMFGVPSPIPVGTSPARQFLSDAPTAPEMRWLDTSVGVEGGVSFYSDEALFEPSGLFQAKWDVDGDDVDAVIAFLSDPANFGGDLKPASSPRFVTDELWTLKVGYQGLIGEYSLLTGNPDEHKFLTLQFNLPP